MQDKLLSIQEAGKLLGVSPKTLRRWEARGIFVPQRTAGNQRRYLKSQIENFKTNRELGVEVEFNPRSSQELIFPESPAQQSSPSIIDWEKRSKDAKNLARKAGLVLTIASFVTLSSLGGLLVLGRAGDYFGGIKNLAPKGQEETLSQGREILAAATEGLNPTFLVNIPSEFEEDAAFLGQIQAVGGIVTGGADIDAGDGSVFASNLLYGVASGSGVLISTGQTPTISNNGVLTLNNTIGDISLKGNGSVSVSTSESDKTVTISSSALTSEADTLATVTGRGATTSTATTFSGGLTVGGNLTLSDTSGVLNLAGGGTLAFKDGTNTLFTIVDSGSYGTVRLSDKGSTGDPSTCTAGDIYFNDTDNTVKACTSANTWEQLDSGGSGGITTFSLAGDSGTTQTITDSDTITIAGGTNGIDTVAGSTDTVTVNLDTTEISDATFGSGSGFTWTFNAGATDPTLAFASDQITLGATSIVMSTFTSNGGVLYTNGSGVLQQVTAGSSTQCLLGGAIPFFGSCEGTGTDAFWQQSSAGLLFPNNLTVDFGIGGTATPSAKFAFINVNSGTPTATLSAGAAGGAYLSATGTLSTTAQQTLTLGTSATGNIVIDSGSSSITLSDATTASSSLTVSGTLTANGALDANGQIDLGDNGDSFSLDSTAFDVSTAGALSGITTLSLSGAISDTDSAVTINDDLTITTGTTISATSITTLNCTDCIDFDDIANTATVDETTDINLGTGIDLYVDLTDTGVFSIRDVATAYWTFDDDSTVDVLLPAAGFLTIDSAATDSTVNGATTGIAQINIDAGSVTSGQTQQGIYLDFQVLDDANANQTFRAQRIDFTNSSDDAADVTYALSLNNANDAGASTATDALLALENNDANTAVADAIVFLAGGANAPDFSDGIDFQLADFTREIVLENGEAIIGQSADTITFEDDDGTDYATLTATALTITGDLAITGGNITTAVTADSTLTVTGTLTANGTLDGNGAFTLGDNGETGVIDTTTWDIDASGNITTAGDLAVNGDDITSDADLNLNPAGGQVTLTDTATLNIGGLTNVAYNALANSGEAPEEAAISSDNDLYVGGDVEIDGTLYAANVTATALAWDDLTAPTADLTLAMGAFNTTFNWDPGADSTETNFSLTTQGEDTTGVTDEDQVLLSLSQASNGVDVDEAADSLLT